jgi:hypothetical protein
MRKLGLLALGVIIACCCFTIALAAEETAAPAADSYGFSPDDVAVNQGVVVYWYAHGYANAFDGYPQKWADLEAKKLPLRKFQSPHTGEDINLDDNSLDFDGDMIYVYKDCDIEVQVKTTTGVVTLPGILEGSKTPVMACTKVCSPCDPCGKPKCGSCEKPKCGSCEKPSCNTCEKPKCGSCEKPSCNTCKNRCCDITICGWKWWGCMSDEKAICKITDWMMWKSFETFECRYGTRPCDDLVWMASGLAPIDKNWKELAPFMTIEYIWGKCTLKKAKVFCCNTCQPCAPKCSPCEKPKCSTPCEKPSCNTCKPKCSSPCEKPKCDTCKPKCGTPKCGTPKCGTPKCGSCEKPSCNTCPK